MTLRCELCSVLSTNQRTLNRHLRDVHSVVIRPKSLCPLNGCNQKMPKGYVSHLIEFHQNYNVQVETIDFNTLDGKSDSGVIWILNLNFNIF